MTNHFFHISNEKGSSTLNPKVIQPHMDVSAMTRVPLGSTVPLGFGDKHLIYGEVMIEWERRKGMKWEVYCHWFKDTMVCLSLDYIHHVIVYLALLLFVINVY